MHDVTACTHDASTESKCVPGWVFSCPAQCFGGWVRVGFQGGFFFGGEFGVGFWGGFGWGTMTYVCLAHSSSSTRGLNRDFWVRTHMHAVVLCCGVSP